MCLTNTGTTEIFTGSAASYATIKQPLLVPLYGDDATTNLLELPAFQAQKCPAPLEN